MAFVLLAMVERYLGWQLLSVFYGNLCALQKMDHFSIESLVHISQQSLVKSFVELLRQESLHSYVT